MNPQKKNRMLLLVLLAALAANTSWLYEGNVESSHFSSEAGDEEILRERNCERKVEETQSGEKKVSLQCNPSYKINFSDGSTEESKIAVNIRKGRAKIFKSQGIFEAPKEVGETEAAFVSVNYGCAACTYETKIKLNGEESLQDLFSKIESEVTPKLKKAAEERRKRALAQKKREEQQKLVAQCKADEDGNDLTDREFVIDRLKCLGPLASRTDDPKKLSKLMIEYRKSLKIALVSRDEYTREEARTLANDMLIETRENAQFQAMDGDRESRRLAQVYSSSVDALGTVLSGGLAAERMLELAEYASMFPEGSPQRLQALNQLRQHQLQFMGYSQQLIQQRPHVPELRTELQYWNSSFKNLSDMTFQSSNNNNLPGLDVDYYSAFSGAPMLPQVASADYGLTDYSQITNGFDRQAQLYSLANSPMMYRGQRQNGAQLTRPVLPTRDEFARQKLVLPNVVIGNTPINSRQFGRSGTVRRFQ